MLRFEEDVLNFLQSPDEALFFPLSLSGYQVTIRADNRGRLAVRWPVAVSLSSLATDANFHVPRVSQRLLAHRTAQYHGLQTATVDDGGDDHGKIKATKPQANLEAKVRRLHDARYRRWLT